MPVIPVRREAKTSRSRTHRKGDYRITDHYQLNCQIDAEYGGLAALRDVIPAEEYREKVLPLLQEALKSGKMTRGQLVELGKKLGGLGSQTLAAVERERPQDKIARAWNDALAGAREGAADFGASFSRQMNEAMRELGETWNSMTRKNAPAPEQKPGTGQGEVAL